jgi:hypothetical protein
MIRKYREYLCTQAQQTLGRIKDQRQRKAVKVFVKIPLKLERPNETAPV